MLIHYSLIAMQKCDDMQIHFEIKNNSSEVVTVLFDEDRTSAKFIAVRPNETVNETHFEIPIMLRYTRGMRLATIKGHFGIGIETDGSITFIQAKKSDETGGWREIERGIPTLYVKRATLAIDEHGNPRMDLYPDPDDGRPIVSHRIYEKLTGEKMCGSAAQILGYFNNMDLRKAYREKMLQWHPDRNKAPEAEDAFKLITWAAEKLGLKS